MERAPTGDLVSEQGHSNQEIKIQHRVNSWLLDTVIAHNFILMQSTQIMWDFEQWKEAGEMVAVGGGLFFLY